MAIEKGKPAVALPKQIREAALRRVALGESPTAVAKSMNIHPSTVRRWCAREDVTVGCALDPEVNKLYETPDAMLDTFKQELKKQNVDAALSMFLDMQNGVEDKYRVLMAQQLYDVFFRVMQNPPMIKTWSDMEKAHKIMTGILNPDKGKGGGRTRLDLQLNVISDKPTMIEAEVVNELEGDGDGE